MNAFLDALNWVLLFMALSGIALMLRALSRKLGEALHMKKYYHMYEACIVIFGASAATVLWNYPDGPWALPARLLFLAGAGLMVGVTIRYWAWILPEIFRPGS